MSVRLPKCHVCETRGHWSVECPNLTTGRN